MSLIFETFPSEDRAEIFVAEVEKRFSLQGEAFDAEDPAQYEAAYQKGTSWGSAGWTACIRQHWPNREFIDLKTQEAVCALAKEFGGTFIGT